MNTAFDFPQQNKFKRNEDWPVDIGLAAGCTLGYIITWIGLICYLYLEHWMTAMLGALIGGLIGWIWYRLVVNRKWVSKA
jgi:high-affinity Fe2+/Pb2+ permease